MLVLHLAHNVSNILAMSLIEINYCFMEKTTIDILKAEKMLNFVLSSILNGDENASSIYPALKAPILIRNDNLTTRE